MKYSESWLREWVNPKLTLPSLSDKLTMAGLEVEEFKPVAEVFDNVVVGQIVAVSAHPEADQLQVCKVNINQSTPLQIVCGATNVRKDMRVAVALIDAKLPKHIIIKETLIRNIKSQGMLCSPQELGLSDEGEFIIEFPADAPVGEAVWRYLALEDWLIDVGITPNRGDCLSIRGLAREISALTDAPLTPVAIPEISATIKDGFKVKINSKVACPHYVGRVIRDVNANIPTPIWLKEKLRRSDIRSINPIVDVANYVMLELGQPMHAFDLATLQQGIEVRAAKCGEQIALLDGSEKKLDQHTLVIADDQQALAIAGVMGGLNSAVSATTQHIFLESAYFSPATVARQRQYYELNSDSAYRFERGVDPTIQREAIERATALILAITGGKAGPIIEERDEENLPKPNTIQLSKKKVSAVLGIAIPDTTIETIFARLHFEWERSAEAWQVKIPLYRFDISLAEDVIEEIARLYGYDKIPVHSIQATLQTSPVEEGQDQPFLRQALTNIGYHEVITYSFIDNKLQALFDPEQIAYELLNPINADMAVMRTNLWPGLINTLLYNKSHQQHRVRLFEIGTCFITAHQELLQLTRLGGLVAGSAYPEQWGIASKEVDFYDLKGDVENLLSYYFSKNELVFKPESHPALHPLQSARIYHQDRLLGVLGSLHPSVLQTLDIANKVFVFELYLNELSDKKFNYSTEISRFPEIRRDIAILVNRTIPAKAIQDTIKSVAGDWLKELFIFDVYQGKGIADSLKSVALALILQHPTRTLVDNEVAELINRVLTTLKEQLGAELRS